jgi:hypothetical protein
MVLYSFDPLGSTNKGAVVMYTNPARADPVRGESGFAGFKSLLDPYRVRPWVWVFDCRGMTAAHALNIDFVRRLSRVLESEHADSLQRVWILNMNSWIRGILQMFPTKKVRSLPNDRLEVLVTLQQEGYSHASIDHILSILLPAGSSAVQSHGPSVSTRT